VDKLEGLRPTKPYPNTSNGYQKDLDAEEKIIDKTINDILKIIEE